ncbi:Uncharacterised protein [Legionella donaldsonii]|uniref:Uncharacterized protein n=2 Tax=Legionella donaldsonii TaxID=45060 RepID=A0A378J446_9GAMM|nr:Uncharacterised protein [Legionella donaldsonii]
MLNLSNCMIKLDRSALYVRLASLIYFSVMVVLYYSAWPCFLKLPGFFLLLFFFLRIKATSIPGSCSLLVYTNNNWQLHDVHGQQRTYAKMRVVMSAGLFFLVEFSHEKQRKLVVIFSDQISKNDFRLLNIIGKIK